MDEYKKYEPIFGSWYLSRLIGKGSFGKVFEITREEFGETYKAALKIITVPQEDDDIQSRLADGTAVESLGEYYEGILKDIVNENRIMSRLKGNSNIVSYEDHLIMPHDDGVGYDILIRMELLTPLLEHIKKKKPGAKEIAKIGADICRGLELCHRKGIIHRDVKPQNIFISENGDYKIGDFGIARTIEKTTGAMSRKGTYNYMAPEVFRGEEYDQTADMYSLGVVLYYLLNGCRIPFLPPPPAKVTHNSEEEARMKRLRGETLPAIEGVDAGLMRIIRKACRPEPDKRYKDAGRMRRALEKYLDGDEETAAEAADANATVIEDQIPRATGRIPADEIRSGDFRNTGYHEIRYNDVPSGNATGRREAAVSAAGGSRQKMLPVIIAAVLAVCLIGVGAMLAISGDKDDEGGDEKKDFAEEMEKNSALEGAIEYEGHHYKVFNDSMTWKEAKAVCEDNDGHLATVLTEGEYNTIVSAIENDGVQKWHYWLGASDADQEGDWRWITGESVSSGFSRWDLNTNQPNNSSKTDPSGENYLEIQATQPPDHPNEYMTWNDICNDGVAFGYEEYPEYCSRKYFGYICEWDY